MRNLTTFILFLLAFTANARQISPDEAAAIASDFLNSSSLQIANARRIGVKRARAKSDTDGKFTSPYYVFNGEGNQGFVIISGDDRAKKILGYSDAGNFDFDNLPPQLAAMLDQYAEQIASLPESAAADPSWSAPPRDASTEEGKLLETANWGQGYPYNAQCPVIDGQRCVTGCVATAMAIVMKYHNWPDKGRGKHKWISNATDSMSYDFEKAEFDYTLMSDTYREGEYNDAQAAEVAKLMQAAGAAVNMQYGLSESGAMSCVVGHYLHEYFKYSPSCQYISASNFEEAEWTRMIHEQIDSNHPVILNGTGTSSRHAFVCDGYNSANLLHINWGWDGTNNGFFQPFVLGGFNCNIGMVINIFNDGNTKEHARCWNDYGYLWAVAGEGAGFNLSVENIEQGVPFSALVGQITFPNDFTGDVCLALVDKDENILEIANSDTNHSFDENHDFDKIGYSWVGHGAMSFANINFSSKIELDGLHVQVVAKEKGDDAWKLVLGSIEAPSYTLTTGNKPYFTQLKWNIHDSNNLTSLNFQNNNQNHVLLGDYCPFAVNIAGGVCYVLINNILRTNGSDFSRCDFNFATTKEEYTIEIYANRYEDLLTRKVVLKEAGTLSTMIPLDEQPLIYDLTIEGCMNCDDFYFIRSNLYSLKHLNIKNTTIDNGSPEQENYMPIGAGMPLIEDGIGGSVWGLESIELPKNLKGFECSSMPYSSLRFLDIPKSVEAYKWHSVVSYGGGKLDFLKINNPIPVEIEGESRTLDFGEYRNRTILYVPIGSKKAYESSPSWRGFKEIRETDNEYIGMLTNYDGACYLIFSDCAVLYGIYGLHVNSFAIPNSVEYNGKSYPVKGTCNNHNEWIKYIILPDSPGFDFSLFLASAPYVITPCISADYIGTYQQGRIYVPGATAKNYSHLGAHIEEMWEYGIDRVNCAIKVKPLGDIDGLVVDSVIINGVSNRANSQGIYRYSPTNDGNLDVIVDYTVEGRLPLSTHYDIGFNASLQDADFARVHEIIIDNDLTLYTGQSWQLSVVVTPETTVNKAVEWSSNNPEVVTVDQYGKVTAVAPGEATITATATDGSGVSASCHVTVNPVLVESLALSPESWSGTEGDTFQITATLMPDNATNKTIEWTTSDAAVATVDSAGVVSVLKAGSCVITASTVDGSYLTAECIITGASGIDSMFADGVKVDVYNANGVLLKRGCGKTELKSLAPGVYIVRDKNKAKTIIIY